MTVENGREEENAGFDNCDWLNDYLWKSQNRKLRHAMRVVEPYVQGIKNAEDFEELEDAIKTVNKAISNVAWIDEELYQKYEYHLFVDANGGTWLAMGKEITTTDRYD